MGIKKSFRLAFSIILCVFIGLKLFIFLQDSGFTNFNNAANILSFENMNNSFDILLGQIALYMTEFSFKGITVYLFFVGLLLRIILFFYSQNQKNNSLFNIYIFFSVCFDIVVLSAPVINGSYVGTDTIRYNIYPFYFSALNNAIVIAYFVNTKQLSEHVVGFGKYMLTGCIILLFCIGISFISPSGLVNYFNYYPETTRQIDEVANKNNLKCGIAHYWDAKKTTLTSKNKLKIYSVYDDLNIYDHVVNRRWFFDNTFNYIVLTSFSDTIHFNKKFDKMQVIKLNEELFIIKVPEFKYNITTGLEPLK